MIIIYVFAGRERERVPVMVAVPVHVDVNAVELLLTEEAGAEEIRCFSAGKLRRTSPAVSER